MKKQNKRKSQRYKLSFSVKINDRIFKGLDLSSSGASFMVEGKDQPIKKNIKIKGAKIILSNNVSYDIDLMHIRSLRNAENYTIVGSEIIEISQKSEETHTKITRKSESATPTKKSEEEQEDYMPSTLKKEVCFKEIVQNAKGIFSYEKINRKRAKIDEFRRCEEEISDDKYKALIFVNQNEFLSDTVIDYFSKREDARDSTDNMESLKEVDIDDIRNLIASGYIKTMFRNTPFENKIHTYSNALATAGLIIASETNVDPSKIYLASIAQGIGAVFLSRELSCEKYESIILNQIRNPTKWYKKECEDYETTHVYAGASLMKKWNVHNDIFRCMLMKNLDEPFSSELISMEVKKIAAVMYLANHVTRHSYKYKDRTTESNEKLISEAISLIGIREKSIEIAIDALNNASL